MRTLGNKPTAVLPEEDVYPRQAGPMPVGCRQIKEILYFGPARPGSPWEALRLVLQTFARVNQLAATTALFAGSCKAAVFTTQDSRQELHRQVPQLRKRHPTRSFIIQTGTHVGNASSEPEPRHYALLTVVDDSARRTLLLDGTIQFTGVDL